jgi:hypothetical protein
MKKEARPMVRVMRPSIRKSQRQPAQPAKPRRWRRAKARREVTIVVNDSVVQKKLRESLDRMDWRSGLNWDAPQSGWQFSGSIEVGEPEYDIWNEATLG